MSRQKTRRFSENMHRENVIEPGKELFTEIKGNWHSQYFKNSNPITLELACGRGEYTVGLAAVYPDRNFIGIDIKGDRIWKGSGIAIANKLDNVGFLRAIIHNLEDYFAPGEVDEIWITFPDPRPKSRDMEKRLTSPRFLALYRNILKPGGTVHLKTDNFPFYEYTTEVLAAQKISYTGTTDLYSDSTLNTRHHGIKTKYEGIFGEKGFKINYLFFTL